MRLCLFEDEESSRLAPLTYARPAFELVCGRFSLRERLVRAWNVCKWGVFVRDYLAAVYREAHPEAAVNDSGWLAEDRTLCVLGRWLPDDLAALPGPNDVAGWCEGQPVAAWIDPEEWSGVLELPAAAAFECIARRKRRVDLAGFVVSRPWDLTEQNAVELQRDFDRFETPARAANLPPGVQVLGDRRRLSVAPGADLEPFVVLDVRPGPVSIESGAKIRAFTRLEGPCHIARDAQIFRAQVTAGTTIGPNCRIGGDVENSIVHGWANKYHDGFLGHSYVCPWVNLGAQSGTSDLKFDYSPVRVPLTGELVETGLKKVGSFIGDHSKTAVNSSFDTGSSIGAMCLVLPDGDLLPRHIPSFSRFWRGDLRECDSPEVLFEIAATAMSRRNVEFTAAQRMLYRLLFDRTRDERRRAIERRHGTRNAIPFDPHRDAA